MVNEFGSERHSTIRAIGLELQIAAGNLIRANGTDRYPSPAADADYLVRQTKRNEIEFIVGEEIQNEEADQTVYGENR
jgi:hypothetical protein